jgi:hypothetical protein
LRSIRIAIIAISAISRGLKALALAIAKVFDGNIRQEHWDRIAGLKQSDTQEGRALASAFKERSVIGLPKLQSRAV